MTLMTPDSTTPKALPDFVGSDFDLLALERIGRHVPLRSLHGVYDDLSIWAHWMLIGGDQPAPNRRSVLRSGYRFAQAVLCGMLEPYYVLFNMANPQHFALLERVTRPLPLAAVRLS